MSLLKIENLVLEKYIGRNQPGVPLLKNINLDIEKDRITCLIGESGAGKTLLALTLAALLPEQIIITRGTIRYEGQPLSRDRLKKLRGDHIFYAPQNAAASLNPVLKIKNQLRDTSKLEPAQWPGLLKSLNFSDPQRVLHSYPFELSGGENQRCLLAMALAQRPGVLILDEPTASLDELLQETFMRLIKEIQQQYRLTILLITHNLSMVEKIAGYVYILLKGEIIEHGTPQELFSSPAHEYTKEIVQARSTTAAPRPARRAQLPQ